MLNYGKGPRNLLSMMIVLWATQAGLLAQSTYFLGVDVPALLGSTTLRPDQIILRDSSSYGAMATLPAGTDLGSLHRLTDGRWLFSTVHPVTLQSSNYEPRDLIAYDGVNFTLYMSGAAAGLPATTRIDALFVDSLGAVILSLDTWSTLPGADFGPSDLIRYNGSFSLYWSATVAGVPNNANLVGAAADGAGVLVLSFDVPVNLGGTEYKPGQLVAWSGSVFTSYSEDPLWPSGAELRDFAFSSTSCPNVACNSSCWDDGTHFSPGTKATEIGFAPQGCEGPTGCVTQICN